MCKLIIQVYSWQALGGNERTPKRMLCSNKQHMFLIFFECRGATSEVVVYRDNLGVQTAKDRVNTITGSSTLCKALVTIPGVSKFSVLLKKSFSTLIMRSKT